MLLHFRTVQVIKLISKDSIEACMLRVGQEKLKLEQDMTTDEGECQHCQYLHIPAVLLCYLMLYNLILKCNVNFYWLALFRRRWSYDWTNGWAAQSLTGLIKNMSEHCLGIAIHPWQSGNKATWYPQVLKSLFDMGAVKWGLDKD